MRSWKRTRGDNRFAQIENLSYYPRRMHIAFTVAFFVRGANMFGRLGAAKVSVGVASVALVSASLMGGAISASAATTSTSVGDMAAGTVIKLPNGGHATLPKTWSQMSIADLAKVGITPGMGSGKTTTQLVPSASVQTHPGAVPANADGWNGYVEINVTGKGRLISNWYTRAENVHGEICTFSVYWAPTGADVLDTGKEVCGGSGYFVGYLTYPVEFSSNYHACNTWVGVSGKPCEYIHS